MHKAYNDAHFLIRRKSETLSTCKKNIHQIDLIYNPCKTLQAEVNRDLLQVGLRLILLFFYLFLFFSFCFFFFLFRNLLLTSDYQTNFFFWTHTKRFFFLFCYQVKRSESLVTNCLSRFFKTKSVQKRNKKLKCTVSL